MKNSEHGIHVVSDSSTCFFGTSAEELGIRPHGPRHASSEFFLKHYAIIPNIHICLNTHITMLQRTLFRASKAAARPISRPTSFTPIRQPVAASLRWYSETPAAAKAGEATSESKPAEASETTQLKEASEKKDKEIVDLKVCRTASPMSNCPSITTHLQSTYVWKC